MPRLSREVVKVREDFVREVFRKEPGLSADKANQQVLAKFGSKLRTKRMYELREQVQAEARKPVTEASRRGRVKTKGKKALPTPLVEANRSAYEDLEKLPFLARVSSKKEGQAIAKSFDMLREAKAHDLKVDHVGDNYVVIDRAS